MRRQIDDIEVEKAAQAGLDELSGLAAALDRADYKCIFSNRRASLVSG